MNSRRQPALALAVWFVYYLHRALASTGEKPDRKQVRKFQRVQASGGVTKYFPRLDATPQGTRAGVLTESPFPILER